MLSRPGWWMCLLVGALIVVPARTASAQAGRQWMSTDGTAPGTPPEIRFDPAASDVHHSFFDVLVHGFWVDTFTGPDGGIYSSIEVPDLGGAINQVGAPHLPAIRFDLAVGTDATQVRMEPTSFLDVFFDVPLVAPEFVPALDDEGGRPSEFVRDDLVYRMTASWPPMDGSMTVPVEPILGSIMGAQVEVYPFHWNPASGQLQVWRQARLHFVHDGTSQTSPQITRRRSRAAAARFDNWSSVLGNFPVNQLNFTGDYLFVYQQNYAEEIKPLVDQKKARGFAVTEAVLPFFSDCAATEALIDAWYAASPAQRDKYCLLVGDVNVIPTCQSPPLPEYPGGVPTDDLYASTIGADLNEEVYLGRLSITGEVDLTNQVAKILAYEDTPPALGNFAEALLVSHRNPHYFQVQESVRQAAYAVPPTFTSLPGHIFGVTNLVVRAEINDGLGLVAYRGAATNLAWFTWNTLSQIFGGVEINALANSVMRPVVWSFTNNTNQIASLSIGESWMRASGRGAVSHYGATENSYILANDLLDEWMFRSVYDVGLTTQSHAIEFAEVFASLIPYGASNAWMYMLLGDPDMQIRRRPPPLNIQTPLEVGICLNPPCEVRISVLNASGMPVSNAQVSLWKPATTGAGNALPGGDEVFDNRYTGADGSVTVPASPSTTGWIMFTVQDDDGNSLRDSIRVVTNLDVPPDGGGAFRFSAAPTVLRGSTFLSFGVILSRPGAVHIHDVTGRQVRTLEAGAGVGGVRWDGTDQSGNPVSNGLYFAGFTAEGARFTTRVVVAR